MKGAGKKVKGGEKRKEKVGVVVNVAVELLEWIVGGLQIGQQFGIETRDDCGRGPRMMSGDFDSGHVMFPLGFESEREEWWKQKIWTV